MATTFSISLVSFHTWAITLTKWHWNFALGDNAEWIHSTCYDGIKQVMENLENIILYRKLIISFFKECYNLIILFTFLEHTTHN